MEEVPAQIDGQSHLISKLSALGLSLLEIAPQLAGGPLSNGDLLFLLLVVLDLIVQELLLLADCLLLPPNLQLHPCQLLGERTTTGVRAVRHIMQLVDYRDVLARTLVSSK